MKVQSYGILFNHHHIRLNKCIQSATSSCIPTSTLMAQAFWSLTGVNNILSCLLAFILAPRPSNLFVLNTLAGVNYFEGLYFSRNMIAGSTGKKGTRGSTFWISIVQLYDFGRATKLLLTLIFSAGSLI